MTVSSDAAHSSSSLEIEDPYRLLIERRLDQVSLSSELEVTEAEVAFRFDDFPAFFCFHSSLEEDDTQEKRAGMEKL